MNRNSALRWFPPIEAAGLPVPKTIFVPYSHSECLPMFDNDAADIPEFHRLVKACHATAEEIGWPVFIRTDLASAKHCGPKAYRATDLRSLCQVVANTLEHNELAMWMGPSPEAFMVRQFLTLPAPFTAFHGLPISREWRIFANEDKIHCEHQYWPLEALEGHVDVDGMTPWIANLADMHRPPEEMPELWQMAVDAARVCGGGNWSVDFCQDDNGKWWLLDMAVMQNSYHWPGCKNEKGIVCG